MLPEARVQALGIKTKYPSKIKDPNFARDGQIWVKDNKAPQPKNGKQMHGYSFYKIGKTFGLQTTRHVEYKDGILYYYNGEKDEQYRGYCKVENLYIRFYLTGSSHHLLYLSNGVNGAEMFFPQSSYLKTLPSEFFKNVVQVNFEEKYKLGDQLGKGSFAKVYVGISNYTKKKVAVKMVSKVDRKGVQTRMMVEEEKKVMARLSSPYLCGMVQFFESDSSFIFVLEYLAGKDLMTFLKQSPLLTLSDAIKIMKQVLEGLRQMHKKSILHRDLKPQNIMINEDDLSAKIIDFGLSLIVHDKLPKGKYKRCGTMGYMALQVISSTPVNRVIYNDKCDAFSFGLIAHMMLLGYNPLRGRNYNETMKLNSACSINLDKKRIAETYGEPCLDFLDGLLQRNAEGRWSVEKALSSQFLNMKHPQIIIKTPMQSEIVMEKDRSEHLIQPMTPCVRKH